MLSNWYGENTEVSRSHSSPGGFLTERSSRCVERMTGIPRLITGLLYGCGLHITEAIRLRVHDTDSGHKFKLYNGEFPAVHLAAFVKVLIAYIGRVSDSYGNNSCRFDGS